MIETIRCEKKQFEVKQLRKGKCMVTSCAYYQCPKWNMNKTNGIKERK